MKHGLSPIKILLKRKLIKKNAYTVRNWYRTHWGLSDTWRPLADIHLKAPRDLICDPNNHVSCHATHAWQEARLWDQESGPHHSILPVQGEHRILIPDSRCTESRKLVKRYLLPALGAYGSQVLQRTPKTLLAALGPRKPLTMIYTQGWETLIRCCS